MTNNIYLLRLRVSGIKSIAEEIELNFYNKILTKFDPELYRIKAIYGENGSGKTGIVTAVNILKKVVLSKNYLLQQENQSLLDELVNKRTKKLKIEVEFAYKEISLNSYIYSLTLEKKSDSYEIIHETLASIRGYTKDKKYIPVFDVENGKLSYLDVDKNNYDEIEKDTMNLLSHSSFLMHFINYKLDDENLAQRDAIMTLVFFVSLSTYLDEEDTHEMYLIMNMIRKGMIKEDSDGIINTFIDRQIDYLDSKGRDIVDKRKIKNYEKKVNKLQEFLKIFKKDLESISIDKRLDGDKYICELVLNYKGYSVNKEFESTGVKKLIRMYDALANVDAGGISFIDEMDSNLNDIYLCKMIEYFMYYGKGQLCFTTHNLDPMTVLKNNKNSIDFLSSDNKLVSWKVTGNAAPDRYYKNGMIEHSPFNIEPADFIGMFGE
ncbi:AAA family ATPase [Pseudobutyrivibrio sp.]|uniref:AAA family ATPase n=1 Tax=Pseudobutyrivibrio sp. TaxID=2014367 RepID=UPI0025DEC772|nr:AAA family ATPase [Pseudobutyrivibrio sp.]MBR5650310.1 AAA family ATPase [Pseudobutyrivibrio sp.]